MKKQTYKYITTITTNKKFSENDRSNVLTVIRKALKKYEDENTKVIVINEVSNEDIMSALINLYK